MADNKYKIQLGVNLDTSDLKADIAKLDGKHKLKLGVDVSVEDIRKRISEYNKNANNAKLHLKVKLDTDDLKQQINNLDLNGKGKGVSIPFNTDSLETSLRELKEVIAEIKTSFNSLDSGNMKSLLSSVNQIVTALGKAENESESLVKSLSALSKKDFNINLGIDISKKGLNTIGYGRSARKSVIPELELQIKELERLHGGQQAAMTKLLSNSKNIGFDIFTGFDDFNSDSAIKKMEAMEKYINALKKLASIDNVNLDGFNNIHKDVSELINDITGVENAVDKAGDVPEKIKNLFGGSVDGEHLTGQLDSVISNLGEIKTAIQGLSSGISIDGLTQSFDRLSETIEKLVSNVTIVKKNLDNIGSPITSVNQASDGVANIENNLKQVTIASDNSSDAIQKIRERLKSIGVQDSSIDVVTKQIEEMGISIREVQATLNGNRLDISVKGVDSLGEIVTKLGQFDTITDELVQSGAKIKQSFSTSDEVIEELNKEIANFIRLQKEIGNKEIEIQTVKSQNGDIEYIKTLERQLERLENTYANLMSTFMKKLQINADIIPMADINRFDDAIIALQQGAEHKIGQIIKKDELKAEQAELNATALNFEKLKLLAKEISGLRIDILQSDDASDILKINAALDKLKNEYNELFAKTHGSLTDNQKSKLSHFVSQEDNKVLREFNNELNEFVKLQKQIENTRFEIGKLEVVGGKENEIAELKRQLEELEDTYNRLMGTFMKKAISIADDDFIKLDDFKSLENGIESATKNAENRLERFKSQYADTRAELAKKIKIDIETGTYDNEFSQMDDKFNRLSGASKELYESVEQVKIAYKAMEDALESTGDEVADRERLIQAEENYARALEKTNNLIRIQARADKSDADKLKLADDRQIFQSKIDAWLTKNSAATKKFGASMLDLKAKAENCDRVTLNHLEKQFKKVDNAAEKAGLKMQSSFDKIKSKFKEYMAYFSVAEVFMYVEQGLREMFNTVKEIDTAMTGLYRVTDLTASEYDTLFNNMINSAKEYGATLNDIINATTDWVRAGFDANTSLGLAEVTTMYQHISDLDYDTAAENLITAYNGFKDELNGAFSGDEVAAVNYIADILNELDNNYAATSAGIGEALTRSASALDLAGNSIQETAGMITGIIEVTQDPEQAGSTLKILSLRLRGMKGQLEELGEETDENVENISKMQGQILNLTNGKVNIFDGAGEFRSTYEIMKDISEVWDDLNSTAQAEVCLYVQKCA